jgi:hypothetical protein
MLMQRTLVKPAKTAQIDLAAAFKKISALSAPYKQTSRMAAIDNHASTTTMGTFQK